MTQHEIKILAATSANHFMAHFCEIMFPMMTLYIADDMKLDFTKVVKAGFLLYMFYGFLAFPWGLLGDKWDAGKAMGLGMLITGAGAVFVGFASSLPMLWIALGVLGIGVASYHPCGMSLISKGVSQRGRALGINGAFGSAGLLAAPFVAAFGGYYIGWRTVFIGIGALAAASGIVSFIFKTDVHRDTEKAPGDTVVSSRIWLYFSIICVVLVMGGLLYRINIVTMPIHLQNHAAEVTAKINNLILGVRKDTSDGKENKEVSTIADKQNADSKMEFSVTDRKGKKKSLGAILLVSFALMVSIIGQFIGGWAADKMDLRHAYIITYALAIPALLGIVFLEGWLLAFCIAMYLLFTLGSQPIENSLIAKLTPPEMRSVAYALKFTLTFGVGSSAVWFIGAVMGTSTLTKPVYIMMMVLLGILVVGQAVLILVSGKENMHQESVQGNEMQTNESA